MSRVAPSALPACRVTIRQHLEAFGALMIFRLFAALPVDGASALGGFLARTIGPLLGISGRAARTLHRAMPELDQAAVRRIIDGMWDNLGRVAGEYPHLRQFRVYEAGGRVETEGIDLLDDLIAAGKQVIFVSAHFGNWEIAGIAASQRGLAITQVYRAPNNPVIDRLIGRVRGEIGGAFIPKGRVAARGAVEALRAGRHLALLVDQKMNDGIAVPFFGRLAMTAPAVAQLALRFDCAVVPVRVDRLRGARFRLKVCPPIEFNRSGDREADIQAIMLHINRVIEGWIRERPELWLWVHRRWPD